MNTKDSKELVLSVNVNSRNSSIIRKPQKYPYK